MSVTAIRTIIKNIVDGVANTGNVYAYIRWANDTTMRDTLFVVNGQIRTFMVEYVGYVPSVVQFGDDNRLKEHTFRVHGYLSLDDSANTDDTMATLTETVCNALDDSAALHDYSTFYDVSEAEPLLEHVTWQDTLCHHAIITQRVTEYRTA